MRLAPLLLALTAAPAARAAPAGRTQHSLAHLDELDADVHALETVLLERVDYDYVRIGEGGRILVRVPRPSEVATRGGDEMEDSLLSDVQGRIQPNLLFLGLERREPPQDRLDRLGS